jgi:hypothetical protein
MSVSSPSFCGDCGKVVCNVPTEVPDCTPVYCSHILPKNWRTHYVGQSNSAIAPNRRRCSPCFTKLVPVTKKYIPKSIPRTPIPKKSTSSTHEAHNSSVFDVIGVNDESLGGDDYCDDSFAEPQHSPDDHSTVTAPVAASANTPKDATTPGLRLTTAWQQRI